MVVGPGVIINFRTFGRSFGAVFLKFSFFALSKCPAARQGPAQRGQVSASCLVQPPEVKPTVDVKSCIKDDKLLLACGKKIPLLRSAF